MKPTKLLLALTALALTASAQTPRSLCLFFDLNSMTAAEQARVQEAAIKFVQKQMTASDVVSVMTSTSDVRVIQDFTPDREVLVAALRGIGLSPAPGGTVENRLEAIQRASSLLAPVAGKKALIYFSSGVLQPSATDQIRFTAIVSAAVHANVAIYPVDARTAGTGNLLPR